MPSKKHLLNSLGVILLVLGSVCVAILIAFFVGEKYYFDKLFYRKSTIFGYYKNDEYWRLPAENEHFLIKRRVRDIQNLVDVANGEKEATKLGDETLKIAVIGDSFAYGMGVKDGQQFPRVLEKKLNHIRPTKVYNLSISGDSILDNYAKYHLAKKYLHIDLFIIATLDNDLQFDSHDKYPGEKEIVTELQKHCPQPEYTYQLPESIEYPEMVKKYFAPSYAEEYANMCFAKEISRQMTGNVVYMMMLQAPDYSATEPDKVPPLTDKLKAVLAAHNQVIDPFTMETFEYTVVSEKEGHPSVKAHEEYAEILYEYVAKKLE